MFKITKTSRILKICPESDVPLVLQNSDIIRKDKLLRRIGSSGVGEKSSNDQDGVTDSAGKRVRKGGSTSYQALEDFRLLAGEITDEQVWLRLEVA